jgi:sigma-E factor negative regulatory protein RseC
MRNPQGQIISMSSAGSQRQVVVEIESAVVCERCESGKGCGAGLLGSQQANKRVAAAVADDLDISTGDRVSIALAPQNVLRAAIIVYGYPLSGAVFAAFIAYTLRLGDIAAALAALVGLATGLLLAKKRLQNASCLREFTPTVIERLPAASH